MLGREFVTSNHSMMTAKRMGEEFVNSVENLFNNWKPRKRFGLFGTDDLDRKYPDGIILS